MFPAEAGIEPSVGSEAVGILEDVEFAVLDGVWWFSRHRLLNLLGYLPPAKYEEAFYSRSEAQALEAVLY